MSFNHRNVLCVDTRCDPTCAHRGPRGELCYFNTEQTLCEILGLIWHPGLELNTLLSLIRDKIAMLPGPEDYDGQVKLAMRIPSKPPLQPLHPATLTTLEEDKDPDVY